MTETREIPTAWNTMSEEPKIEERTEETELERVHGPAVVVRLHHETGPSVSVEWWEAPTPGEIIVIAERLLGRWKAS